MTSRGLLMVGLNRALALGSALLATILTAGCDAPIPEPPGGVASDSAGVRLVDLPPAAAGGRVSELVVDSFWDPAAGLEIGDLTDLAILDDGSVLLLDELAGTLTLLSTSGEVVAVIGAEGQGPGEFNPQGLSQVVATDSSVFVPDLFLQRLTEFSIDGQVLRTSGYPLPAVYAVDWRRHPESGLAFRALEQPGDKIIRWDEESVDTILAVAPSSDSPNLLLTPVVLWDLTDEGDVLLARTDRGEVELRKGGTGELVWRSRWPREGPEVGKEDVAHLEALVREQILRDTPNISAELLASNLSSMTYPDEAPVLAGLMAAPGGAVWIRRAKAVQAMGRDALRIGSADAYGGRDWDVLNRDGYFKETVRLPDRFTPIQFRGGWLYGVLADNVGVERPARVPIEGLK